MHVQESNKSKCIVYSACTRLSPISHITNLGACPGENYYNSAAKILVQ